jgi:hypothetical protein
MGRTRRGFTPEYKDEARAFLRRTSLSFAQEASDTNGKRSS